MRAVDSTSYVLGFGKSRGAVARLHHRQHHVCDSDRTIFDERLHTPITDSPEARRPSTCACGEVVGIVQRSDADVANKQNLLITTDSVLAFLKMSGCYDDPKSATW
jgi:hypothetical protein